MKKQKHDFQVCFINLTRHQKSSWRQGLTDTKRSMKVAKRLFEREKTERTWGKERVGTNFENILCWSKKERICSTYNKTIIRFGFCDIQNNQGLSKRLITPMAYDPRQNSFFHFSIHYWNFYLNFIANYKILHSSFRFRIIGKRFYIRLLFFKLNSFIWPYSPLIFNSLHQITLAKSYFKLDLKNFQHDF